MTQFLKLQHHKVLFVHDSGENITSCCSSLVRNRLFLVSAVFNGLAVLTCKPFRGAVESAHILVTHNL